MQRIAVVLLALAAACNDGRFFEPVLYEGFEGGLLGWEKGFELPLDPNRPGEVVDWAIEATVEEAARGLFSARLYVDGRQDDGTIWIATAIDAEPLAAYEVRLEFELWSGTESFNTLAAVAAYAGPVPPETETDFDLTQQANLAAGWRLYRYVLDAQSDAIGRLWVAVGITVLWETELEYFLDEVRVALRRAP